MNTVIYSILPIPIDICNIIISYATSVVNQIYDDMLRYECDGKLYDYHYLRTMCVINNCIYSINVDGNDTANVIFTSSTTQTNVCLGKKTYVLKYFNGLICEHYNAITIYDVNTNGTITTSIRCTKQFDSQFMLLLYVDSKYIITRLIDYGMRGMVIYNHNLKIHKKIYTSSSVKYVALYNGILSYCKDKKWLAIKL